jgi:hypothetical protein
MFWLFIHIICTAWCTAMYIICVVNNPKWQSTYVHVQQRSIQSGLGHRHYSIVKCLHTASKKRANKCRQNRKSETTCPVCRDY